MERSQASNVTLGGRAHGLVTRIGQSGRMREWGNDSYEGSLLEPGRDCWRVDRAHRFTPLMENKAYFDALASSLQKASQLHSALMPYCWKSSRMTDCSSCCSLF